MVVMLSLPVNLMMAAPALADKPEEVPVTIQIETANGVSGPFSFSCPENPTGNPFSLTGSGAGSAPPGLIEQYKVQVDWGDGSVTNGLGDFTPSSGQGAFTFVFSAGAHQYTSNGSYTVKARLYHSQPPGQDNQADVIASVDVCISDVNDPICGDENEDNGEDCDDGNHVTTDACDTFGETPNTNGQCSFTYCGDGVKQSTNGIGETEECDGDDGAVSGYECNQSCELEEIILTCEADVELVANGSFEEPVVTHAKNWNVFDSSATNWVTEWVNTVAASFNNVDRPVDALLELHKGIWTPFAGGQYAELDTDWVGPDGNLNGEPASVLIYQDINTIPGETYEVNFAFSGRPQQDDSENVLEFSWGGNLEDTLTADTSGESDTDWSEHSYQFIATSNTTRLQFADGGDHNSLGTFLDDVSVKCIPSACGNDEKEEGEECDGTDGVTDGYYCTDQCELAIPYCGDNVVNQEWEQCDGGNDCTEQCQNEVQNECSDLVLAKIAVADVQNQGNGDMTSDIYLGSDFNVIPDNTWFALYYGGNYQTDADIAAYQNVPGLAVQRLEGRVRTVLHGALEDEDLEHVNGTLEFYNATIPVGGLSSDNSSDTGESNKLENATNGTKTVDPTDDEIKRESSTVASFWYTTDVANDGSYTNYEIVEDCNNPVYCGDGFKNQEWEQCDGGDDCTEQCQNKVQNECSDLVLAKVTIDEQDGVYNEGAGDSTNNIFVGSDSNELPSGTWFALYYGGNYQTDSDITGYEDVPGLAVQRLEGKVRTVIHAGSGDLEHLNGTIDFYNASVANLEDDTSDNNKLEKGFDNSGVGLTPPEPGDDEVWISGDHQSSFWLSGTTADDGYYTVYDIDQDCDGPAYCGDGFKNQEWEQCDGGDDCTEQCQDTTQNQCSDLVLARVNIDQVDNQGAGNMTNKTFVGSDSNELPNGTWFPLYYNGSYVPNDPDISGYEDVAGLAVQRLEGRVRVLLHADQGSNDDEHVDGTIEFWNASVTGLENDTSDDNKLEESDFNEQDGLGGFSTTNDEVWVSAFNVSSFWLTADTADDAYFTDYQITDDCGTSICGVKYYDRNENETQDNEEEGLEDWTIKLWQLTSCEAGDEWADSVEEFNQGTKGAAGTVDANRSIAAKALGAASTSDEFEFVSLGLNDGELILKFDNVIVNDDGDDLKVHETSFGSPTCANYPEYVTVYASQTGTDGSWVELGTDCQEGEVSVDLGILPWAQYVKLVDATDINARDFNKTGDGFDVDAVEALNCANWVLIDTQVTDEDGGYCFAGVAEGEYWVSEMLQPGWTNVTPLYQSTEVTLETPNPEVDFGNFTQEVEENHVCGYKWEDTDGDGEWDTEELPLSGWEIKAEKGDTMYTTPTNENGWYCFTELENGTWEISEIQQDGWYQTYPADEGSHSVQVTEETGSDHNNFGNFQVASIEGKKYLDRDYNGEINEGTDSTDDGWEINITGPDTDTSTTTDEFGYYYFNNLGPGEYTVTETPQNGWTQIIPTISHIINVLSGNVHTANFLNSDEVDEEPVCGNEIQEDGEQCDDGNDNNDDECTNQCTLPDNGGDGDGDNGGGGGGGGGGFTSLYIHTESAQYAGTVTATIEWYTNKPATSRVVYDTVSHDDFLDGPPNYGYAFSTDHDPNKVTFHSVTIEGLTPGVTYYFRPISSASPEVWGVELALTPGGGDGDGDGDGGPTPPTPPTGPGTPPGGFGGPINVNDPNFQPSLPGIVAGAEFEEGLAQADTAVPNVEVEVTGSPAPDDAMEEAAEEETANDCALYLWLLLILNIIASGWLWSRSKNETKAAKKNGWLIGLILALLPLAIWYPACWIIWWLLATLVGMIVAGMGSKNESNQTQEPSPMQ